MCTECEIKDREEIIVDGKPFIRETWIEDGKEVSYEFEDAEYQDYCNWRCNVALHYEKEYKLGYEPIFGVLKNIYEEEMPEDFQKFVFLSNAAYPVRDRIIIDGKERILKKVLIFNHRSFPAYGCYTTGEHEFDRCVWDIIGPGIERDDDFKELGRDLRINHLVPFAEGHGEPRESFYNFFCYSLKSHTVVYYISAEKTFVDTGLSLKEFEDTLY